MSDLTSPILPRSSLNSDELADFGGDEAFASAWRDGLTPDALLAKADTGMYEVKKKRARRPNGDIIRPL